MAAIRLIRRLGALAPVLVAVAAHAAASPFVLIDQFGYRPDDPKVAVLRDPVHGYDAAERFSPGNVYDVRRVDDDRVVLTGAPVAWNGGEVQASSGDRGWWFDFSALEEPGRYVIVDRAGGQRSAPFRIAEDVYRPLLKAAMRTFYYQRSGFAKKPPYAESCWADEAAYLGPRQEGEARAVDDRRNASKVRDLRGGWFDAGDTNKYVTFASSAVHQLLAAFESNPQAFTDDFGIPESGNGVPDLLDEVAWETGWLERMQFPDGGVALKVGQLGYTKAAPPSSDRSERYYVPACTSATIAAAGMMAHAAWHDAKHPSTMARSGRLAGAAQRAWQHFQSAPALQEACDDGTVKAGDADWSAEDQRGEAVVAAVYLFALTGEERYGRYVREHYRESKPYRDAGWMRYRPQEGEALLFYTTLPDADPSLRERILADKAADVHRSTAVYGFVPGDDLYRAFLTPDQYHWGSHLPRANTGSSNLDALRHTPAAADAASLNARALGILHYFHGVNPFGLVYLSNMKRLGATRSANSIYHTWFTPGTKWSDASRDTCGPAPGFVPGGPNASAGQNGVPARLAPPAGQPPQKSYRDWNADWPESSWVVAEPAIYYQASYVRLLAGLVR